MSSNLKYKEEKIEKDFKQLMERYNKSKNLIDQLCQQSAIPSVNVAQP